MAGVRATRSYAVPANAGLDLEAEAALVTLLWRAAPHCTLVHDVSDGGVAVALEEAIRWSGIGASVDLPDDAAAILACAPSDVGKLSGMELVEIGVAG